MTPYFQQYGRMLLDGGYRIVPVVPGQKRPAIKDWPRARLRHADLARFPDHGVGVLCGQGETPVVAFDVDTSDPELAETFSAWCERHLGAPLKRVGKAPKILLLYRAEHEGWSKSTSACFKSPNNDSHQLEVLGNGQQFAAYHTHPDTGKPYVWTDAQGGASAVRAADLTVVSQVQVHEAVVKFEAIAESLLGFTRTADSRARYGEASNTEQDAWWFKLPVGLDVDRARELLSTIEAEDYDLWLRAGMALHHEFRGSDEGLDLWDEWASSASTYIGREDLESRWAGFGQGTREPTTARWLLMMGKQAGAQAGTTATGADAEVETRQIEDFYAYLPTHQYIHRPTRAFWPAASVDGYLPGKIEKLRSSAWLDLNRAVQQATWHPAHGELLEDVVVADGGFVPQPGALVYNRYRPPLLKATEDDTSPWLEHVHTIYPGEADHIIKWLAHRVQRPGEKINHALVLGGSQGIGKDTILEPVRRGVGPWNWADIDPKKLTGAFNPFVESVVLRINEARDLGDIDRFAFYDHSKTYIAAPPDVLMCNNKYAKEYPVFNVMGVILTTNHKTNGIYLPMDDRRHYVAWSEARKEAFADQYWRGLWDWLNTGGTEAVVGYLQGVDLSGFNPKAPPPKTEAFYAIVQANANPDDVALVGITLREDGTKMPVVTIDELAAAAGRAEDYNLVSELTDRRNRRRLPHMMERAGYVPVRNPDAKDGLWRTKGRQLAIYADSALSYAEQIKRARASLKPVVS